MFTADETGTYDRILKVTMEQIRGGGVSSVKLREVALKANVNLASINYHFQSKERLLLLSIKKLVFHGMKEALSAIDDVSFSPEERLKRFLVTYVKIMREFHEPMRHLMISDRCTPDNMKGFEEMVKELGINKYARLVAEISGIKDKNTVFLLCTQLLGAALVPNFMKEKAQPVFDIELPEIEEQIEFLLSHYLLPKQA